MLSLTNQYRATRFILVPYTIPSLQNHEAEIYW